MSADKMALAMAKKKIKKLEEENKKLEEEIKKQKKEHIQKMMNSPKIRIGKELYCEVKYALGYGETEEPDRKVMYDEINKLKEYETMIYNVWSDLYWADKEGCEVSFKDIADSCNYYDNEEFVKKEVVEEEDSDEEE